MLDAWIIEDLKRREPQPSLQLPLLQLPASPEPASDAEDAEEEDGHRGGVIVIDMV